MPDHRLPADLSAWPRDFHRLLGVKSGVDRRELRRAYTALLREFRPEEFPEHFRRLREAYEAVLQQVAWREKLAGANNPPNQENDHADELERVSDDPPASEPHDHSPTANEPLVDPPAAGGNRQRAASWHDQVDALWEETLAGDADAYLRFAALEQQTPGRRELCLRLYWLLVVWPDLDRQRVPCDWLARGLRAAGMAGPLMELYRREIDREPTEALTPRCAALLQSAARPEALADLVACRWIAAGRLDLFETIADDIGRLRERFVPAAEEVWCQLLALAVEQMLWSPSPVIQEQVNKLVAELDATENIHLVLRHSLDRIDVLRSVTAGWRPLCRLRVDPVELLQLVRSRWLRPWHKVEPEARRILDDLGLHPTRALQVFDQINKFSRSVLAQIGQLIESRLEIAASELPANSAQLMNLARLMFDAYYAKNYASLRPHLLEFCIREQITPDWIVSQSGDPFLYPVAAHQAFVKQVLEDAPLRFAYLANRAIQA